ncbi:MAG: GNAT family N-acetyltransferase [Paludibacteraceae bacterium]|nr:GNAT family N-acetyltransferase [Paludibacteraceae bacterium]
MSCEILTYNDIDGREWEALVEGSATGTWFQTPEAYAFYASQKEIMRPFVLAVRWQHPDGSKQSSDVNSPKSDDSKQSSDVSSPMSDDSSQQTLRGVCCGYVTIEKNPLKQYFTRRAIIIGGPVLADDCRTEEAYTLMQAVRRHLMTDTPSAQSPIYIETRNFNDYSRWKEAFEQAEFRYQPHLNFHFDCTDKDAIWTRLSETRRRQINKSVKSGTTIEEARTEEEITEWYAILSDLYRRRVKTPLFPLSFFLDFFRQKRGVYLLVKHEGRVIGGMMCPIHAGKCLYEWFVCGLDTAYKDQYPSVMATWAAMVYAHEHGIPKFDIMGAGVPGVPYGVRDFKAEFGGTMVEYGRFLHIAKPLLYRIGEAGVAFLKRQ